MGALVVLVLGLALVACGGASDDDPADDPGGSGSLDDAVVTVRFTDSSVPPPYHRSWEVVVEPTTAAMVVTSYGNELASTTVSVDAATREDFLADLSAALEEIGTDDVGEVCPGGTSTGLEIDGAGDLDRDVTAAPSCGEDPRPEQVADAIEELVAPFRDALGLDKAIETD